MHTQIYSLCLVAMLAVVSCNRIPDSTTSSSGGLLDNDVSSRRSSSSRRANRAGRREGRRAPRLFDEFLQIIAISGEIPEVNPDGSFRSPTSASSFQSAQQRNSSGDLLSSMRNYIHQHRPSAVDEVEDVLAEEVEIGNVLPSSDRRNIAQRSSVADALRRHSRRDVDFSAIETSLNGVSRDHWSCCFLGSLAGDKGFLCDSQFYATRVLGRNANRVHNRRLTGTYFEHGEATTTGSQLLTAFNSCVQTTLKAREFESCCTRESRQFAEREDRWHTLEQSLRTNS